MSNTTSARSVDVFAKQLADYKSRIDADIEQYSKQLQTKTLQNFGANSRVALDAYLEILGRGGKRIRGALTIAGYEMAGGTDGKMIVQAARAVELIHAYLLVIDDINDRSPIRRGGLPAHLIMSEYYRSKDLGIDDLHFGESIAIHASLVANHTAQSVLLDLDVSPELKIRALDALNQSLVVTGFGQANDVFNEVLGSEVDERAVMNVLEWKTAHYTFLSPLQLGMILAGASDEQIKSIKPFAMNAGLAFQISDDNLGVFGTEFESGKSPLDDIREGKCTLLATYALEHGSDTDKNFLMQMLGKSGLTQLEFERVKDILLSSGALRFAKDKATFHVHAAQKALDTNAYFDEKQTVFLRSLADFLLTRNT
ncbi:MAG: Polyprenyl synthetase family protein [Patescibacteria group bacterium]|jgi:geranylgeranyl pyrophosphate synthase|nr:Polyprenyl synthetase family protein [Patescibacteria group bacterium]